MYLWGGITTLGLKSTIILLFPKAKVHQIKVNCNIFDSRTTGLFGLIGQIKRRDDKIQQQMNVAVDLLSQNGNVATLTDIH